MSYGLSPAVEAMKDLHLEGNIIPMEWFSHLRFDSGKPDMNAILILSDIVYWYRPTVVRDEQTGLIIGYRKKFKSDLLQKSYQHYADLFGLSKRQVTDAIIRLEEKGLIRRIFRSIDTPSMTLQNILFIALNVQKVREINVSVGGLPIERDAPHDRKGYPSHSMGTPPPIERDTCTKTTTEITTKTHSQARTDVSTNMLENWNRILCPPVAVQMTSARSARLKVVLAEHFQGNPEQWASFCREIRQSSFLMGQGQRGWRVTLDWILESRNLQKTFEGNYHHGENVSAGGGASVSLAEMTLTAQQHIDGLETPLSQQFCRALLRYMPTDKYLRWFSPAEIGSWDGSRLVLSFPSKADRNYVERHFSSEIGAAAQAVCPEIQGVDYEVRTAQAGQVLLSPSAIEPVSGDGCHDGLSLSPILTIPDASADSLPEPKVLPLAKIVSEDFPYHQQDFCPFGTEDAVLSTHLLSEAFTSSPSDSVSADDFSAESLPSGLEESVRDHDSPSEQTWGQRPEPASANYGFPALSSPIMTAPVFPCFPEDQGTLSSSVFEDSLSDGSLFHRQPTAKPLSESFAATEALAEVVLSLPGDHSADSSRNEPSEESVRDHVDLLTQGRNFPARFHHVVSSDFSRFEEGMGSRDPWEEDFDGMGKACRASPPSSPSHFLQERRMS